MIDSPRGGKLLARVAKKSVKLNIPEDEKQKESFLSVVALGINQLFHLLVMGLASLNLSG